MIASIRKHIGTTGPYQNSKNSQRRISVPMVFRDSKINAAGNVDLKKLSSVLKGLVCQDVYLYKVSRAGDPGTYRIKPCTLSSLLALRTINVSSGLSPIIFSGVSAPAMFASFCQIDHAKSYEHTELFNLFRGREADSTNIGNPKGETDWKRCWQPDPPRHR